MGKLTFVVDFPEGAEPAVYAGMNFLNGKITAVAFKDLTKETEWRSAVNNPPDKKRVVLLSDGCTACLAYLNEHKEWKRWPYGESVDESDMVLWLYVPMPEEGRE